MKNEKSTHEKYSVFCRYERWAKEGKVFTTWFRTGDMFDNEADAKALMKEKKSRAVDGDRRSKLRHEFEVRKIDVSMLYQCKLHAGKGRYPKIDTALLDEAARRLEEHGETSFDTEWGKYVYNTEAHRKYIEERVPKVASGEKWVRFWYDTWDSDDNRVYATLKSPDEKLYDFC